MTIVCSAFGADNQLSDNFSHSYGAKLGQLPEGARSVSGVGSRVMVGIFCVTMGSLLTPLAYLFGIIPLLALGLSALILGIMVLYLPEGRRIPSQLATGISLSALTNIERLLEELYLDERGIYIPTTDIEAVPKVFIPLVRTDVTARPPLAILHSDRMFTRVSADPDSRGILLDALGGAILVQLEKWMDSSLATVSFDDLENVLRDGFQNLDLTKKLNLEHSEHTVNISLDLSAMSDFERDLRNVAPRLVSQIGGPIESAIVAAIAKTTQRYALIEKTEYDPSRKRIRIAVVLQEVNHDAEGRQRHWRTMRSSS